MTGEAYDEHVPRRLAATAAADMCPSCHGDNEAAWGLCARCEAAAESVCTRPGIGCQCAPFAPKDCRWFRRPVVPPPSRDQSIHDRAAASSLAFFAGRFLAVVAERDALVERLAQARNDAQALRRDIDAGFQAVRDQRDEARAKLAAVEAACDAFGFDCFPDVERLGSADRVVLVEDIRAALAEPVRGKVGADDAAVSHG